MPHGCTALDSRLPVEIPPGEDYELAVTFHCGEVGTFDYPLPVYIDDGDRMQTIVLRVRGTIAKGQAD